MGTKAKSISAPIGTIAFVLAEDLSQIISQMAANEKKICEANMLDRKKKVVEGKASIKNRSHFLWFLKDFRELPVRSMGHVLV